LVGFLTRYAEQLSQAKQKKQWGPNPEIIRTILGKINNSANKVVKEQLNKDEEFRDFLADFETRFKVDDENFPKIEDEITDSDDSVIINKHPFAIRKSDFEGIDRLKFNSVSRYVIDDDDSDKDDSDEDSDDDEEEEEDAMENRRRTKGVSMQAQMGEIIDLEGEVEVEEIVNRNIEESVVIGGPEELLSSYEEIESKEKVRNELMSPVDSKKKLDEEDDDE